MMSLSADVLKRSQHHSADWQAPPMLYAYNVSQSEGSLRVELKWARPNAR